MTKFILVGGYIRKAPDGGKGFCEELIKDHAEPVKILDCMFARLRETWDKAFADDKEMFATHVPGKKLDIQLAQYDTFVEQVKWADVVFLRGGSSEELIAALQERKEWTQHLDGKTVAGTSAGADALSKYYFGLDSRQVRVGLGLVDAKVIPHFKSDYHGWEFDWDGAYQELQAHKEELPILALAEGAFVIK